MGRGLDIRLSRPAGFEPRLITAPRRGRRLPPGQSARTGRTRLLNTRCRSRAGKRLPARADRSRARLNPAYSSGSLTPPASVTELHGLFPGGRLDCCLKQPMHELDEGRNFSRNSPDSLQPLSRCRVSGPPKSLQSVGPPCPGAEQELQVHKSISALSSSGKGENVGIFPKSLLVSKYDTRTKPS